MVNDIFAGFGNVVWQWNFNASWQRYGRISLRCVCHNSFGGNNSWGNSSLNRHKCRFFRIISIAIIFLINVCLSYVEWTQITTSRPRRPDNNDEYHNRQITYYGPDNQRLGRPQQYHYLRLIWVEQDTNLEYTLRYNTSRRGFWISSSPQKGRGIWVLPFFWFWPIYHTHKQAQWPNWITTNFRAPYKWWKRSETIWCWHSVRACLAVSYSQLLCRERQTL